MGTTVRRLASARLQALRSEAGLETSAAPKPLSHYFVDRKPKQALKGKAGRAEPARV